MYYAHPFYRNKYRMGDISYNKTTFLLSATELKQLPADNGSEVALIGCSNAGKSSAINAIANIKNLARTSKTPGRTQTINVYTLTEQHRLVDLPGYGYTKAPASVSKRWTEKVNEYLQKRRCLKGLILVMDIRHPLKDQDQRIIAWAVQCELPLHILLTKTDKLSRTAALQVLQQLQQKITPFKKLVTVQLFSSHSKQGLEEAHQKLTTWFS